MFGLFMPVPLGLNRGTGSVKVIGLNGKKISLAAFMDIPSSDWEEEALLINRLQNFFKEITIDGRDAVVHMPGHLSCVRTINLPPMPKGELKEAVKWEVKRQLSYLQEEAVYDYIAAPVADGIVVTFASAERENVQRYIAPFKEAGLKVVAVDVNPLCLIRALGQEHGINIIINKEVTGKVTVSLRNVPLYGMLWTPY